MVYVFGIAGFILGFVAGLFVIHLFLKNLSRRELVQDKSLRWTYGLAVWIMAGIGTALGLWLADRSGF